MAKTIMDNSPANGANQFVKLDSNGKLPVLDASALTNVSGGSATDYQFLIAENNGVSTSNTAAQNSSAMSALFVTAKNAKKGIKIGGGVFLFNTIAYDPDVPLVGAGIGFTFLKSASAVPLISYTSTVMKYVTQPKIEDLTLDGNDIGTIGMQVSSQAYFAISRIKIINFTGWAAVLPSNLEGTFSNCSIQANGNGITATVSGTSIGGVQPNLFTFNDCYFQYNRGVTINWSSAASVQFRGCDFEGNGTDGDLTTGVIRTSDFSPASEGVDVIIDGCWIEINHGGPVFKFGASNGRSIIQNTLMKNFIGTSNVAVENSSKLSIINSEISGYITTDVSTLAGGLTEVLTSNIGNHIETGNGVYRLIGVNIKPTASSEDMTGATSPVINTAFIPTTENIISVYKNGALLPATGYTRSGGTYTLSVAPISSDVITVNYYHYGTNNPNVGAVLPTANKMLHLQADAGVVASGTALTSWTDQSTLGTVFSNGHGVAQYLATDPDFGHAIYLPGTSGDTVNSVVLEGSTTLSGMTTATIFMVAKGDSGYYITNRVQYDGLGPWFSVGDGITQTGQPYEALSYAVNPSKKLMRIDITPSNVKIYINSILVATSGANPTVANNHGMINIGGFNSIGTTYVSGGNLKVAEVVAYNSTLTPTQITGAENYLKAKYSL